MKYAFPYNTARVSKIVFDRTIADLIFALDRVADRIPPDDLGGADEAVVTINTVVDLLQNLRSAA
jgi:hypothetical protein